MTSRTISFLYAFWLAVLAVFAACQAASADEVKSLRAKAIAEPIALDGSLNEPAWQDVQPAGGFIQREPATGAPATEETEVRIAYTPTGFEGDVFVCDLIYPIPNCFIRCCNPFFETSRRSAAASRSPGQSSRASRISARVRSDALRIEGNFSISR
jgi:hypothetical protein